MSRVRLAGFASDNWGHRARIGIFIVGAEPVPEAEWWAMAPPGVSIHAARIDAPAPWATWRRDGQGVTLSGDLDRGARHFAALDASAVVIAHSSSSIAGGTGWDEAVRAELGRILPPTTRIATNGVDCLRALEASGITRPFVVFPAWFGEAIMDRGLGYLAEGGQKAAASLRYVPEERWRGIPPGELYARRMHLAQGAEHLFAQIVSGCPDDADGVLIVGTGVRCVAIIAALELALKRPVVTANQASLWRCLDLLGIGEPVTGYGQLLERPRSAP